jgi:hypothetical protein
MPKDQDEKPLIFWLTAAECEVLRTLIEFHWHNDESGHGYYNEVTFDGLATKLFPELAKQA